MAAFASANDSTRSDPTVQAASNESLGIEIAAQNSGTVGSLLLPSVTAVRNALTHSTLTVASASMAPTAVRNALFASFGNQVTKENQAFAFLWHWDAEERRWVLVCLDNVIFQVNLASKVFVTVAVRVSIN